MNTTRAGIRTERYRSGPTLHGTHPGLLPRALFVWELLDRGLIHLAQDEFRGRAHPAALAELGVPVMVRADGDGDEIEAVVRLPDGALALVDAGYEQVSIEVAAQARPVADAAAKRLRERLRTGPRVLDRVSFAFWMRDDSGGEVRHRDIEAPTFASIGANYPAGVRAQLERLLAVKAPANGRLILWRGAPGTGKSHALRALAREWADWCSAHFIMDPGEFLGQGGAYMLDVLTSDDDEDRWRLVILEDAGELIAVDARAAAGQALSRLLNIADGLIGQGTNTLVLITTNEPLGRLHPAARRPGRCLADIEFLPFSPAEARAWFADRGQSQAVDGAVTLAELFNDTDGGPGVALPEARFGFARALDES